MTVLITGGSGMIGSYTAARLIEERDEPPVLYDLNPVEAQIAHLPPEVVVVCGDVLDTFRFIQTVQQHGVDRIIHLAGFLNARFQEAPYQGVQTNVGGILNVLEIARTFGLKRVVLASTGMNYDFREPATAPITEDHRLFPETIYATTKLTGEFLGLNYWTQFGVDFVALRFPRVFGPGYKYPGATPNAGVKFIKQLIEGAAASRTVHVQRPLIGQSEWVYVKDVAQGLVRAAFVEHPAHRVFNIGNGVLRTLDEIIAIARRLYPEVTFDLVEPVGRPPDATNWTQPYDISRAREGLGYVPAFPMEKALADYAEIARGFTHAMG